jgi:hypothetical protein
MTGLTWIQEEKSEAPGSVPVAPIPWMRGTRG